VNNVITPKLHKADFEFIMNDMKDTKLQFASIVWKEGKYFVAQCLNIDVSSFGKTKKEALKNLDEAVELYLEDRPRKLPKIASPSIEMRMLQHA